jgi:TPR repeat protein
VPQDHTEAVRWYKKAADQGLARAQFNLCRAYHLGEGVPQDDAEAVRWLRKAADQGVAKAQALLGAAYDQGEGVPKDKAKAYLWANLAAAISKDAEDDSYSKLRDSTAAKLSPGQRSAIQERCRRWMNVFEKRQGQEP